MPSGAASGHRRRPGRLLRWGVALTGLVVTRATTAPSWTVDGALEAMTGVFQAPRAMADVAFFAQFWRIPGSSAYGRCVDRITGALEAAGYRRDDSTAALRYIVDAVPLPDPVWIPVDASLILVYPRRAPLHSFAETPVLLCEHSGATPADGIIAPLVWYDAATLQRSRADGDVAGRIILTDGHPADFVRYGWRRAGALGVLSAWAEDYNQTERYPDLIREAPLPPGAGADGTFALKISLSTCRLLQQLLAGGGTVRVRVQISVREVPGVMQTVIAQAGATGPQIVLAAHLDHYQPGANDNASGAATLLEIARSHAALRTTPAPGSQPAARGVTFLWGKEFDGVTAWKSRQDGASRGTLAAIVLDMVGEDAVKTGAEFLVERTPDPAVLAPRPPDRHTAWGTNPPPLLGGSFLNDFYLMVCRKRAATTGWAVGTNPWEGGSDHDTFIEEGIPAVLNWHFPDPFYHTSLDGPDQVSAAEMTHVGVAAGAAALFLANPAAPDVLALVDTVAARGAWRLETVSGHAQRAVADAPPERRTTTLTEERALLDQWTRWYEEALASLRRVPPQGVNDTLERQVTAAVSGFRAEARRLRAAIVP